MILLCPNLEVVVIVYSRDIVGSPHQIAGLIALNVASTYSVVLDHFSAHNRLIVDDRVCRLRQSRLGMGANQRYIQGAPSFFGCAV